MVQVDARSENIITVKFIRSTCQTQLGEHVIIDLWIISSSPMLSVLKNKIMKNKIK